MSNRVETGPGANALALDESNGGEILHMCASSNMAVYAMEMT